MANLAVFASGNGANFQAIVETVRRTSHSVRCLVCDRAGAFVLERAKALAIPAHVVSYSGRLREESETEILRLIEPYAIDLIALAGFMRLLTPRFVDRYREGIINIHPALLPKYPGTHAIAESYESRDTELGITIHRVDYGMDTGPIIVQESFRRVGSETMEEIELRIHNLEHATYPRIVTELLDSIDHRSR